MILALSTNKGGVLKTTTAVNIAALYAMNNYKTLLVDADSQGDCSLSFGLNPDKFQYTIYDVLTGSVPIDQATLQLAPDLELLPSNEDLVFFEKDVLQNMNQFPKPYSVLKDKLGRIKHKYDVIVIDSPPNLGLTVGNVLTAADQVIVPFQPENYSLRSMIKTIDAIHDIKREHNRKLQIRGVVNVLVDNRTTMHKEMMKNAADFLADQDIPVFQTLIPRSIEFAKFINRSGLPLVLNPRRNDYTDLLHRLWEEIEHGKR